MRLKPRPLEFPEANPFAHDKLGRKPCAEVLTQILRNTAEPLVLALDASWGSGKTTFIEMWCLSLRGQDFHTLYFNAWRNDFASEPLVAFIGEMRELATSTQLRSQEKAKVNERLKKAKSIGKKIIARAVPVAVKMMTAGVLEIADIQAAKAEESLSDVAEKLVAEQIDSYKAQKDSLEAFRRNLEALVTVLRAKSKLDTPLVFFIDELDRCRPTYAVALLERLKHLFSVPGIAFVLALDMHQLAESVRGVYGSGIRAEGYLRRFIDLEYRLPQPALQDYLRSLFDRFAFDVEPKHIGAIDGEERNHFIETVALVALVFRLRPRELEQLFTRLTLVLKMSGKNESRDYILLAFMLGAYLGRRELFDQMTRGEISIQQVDKSIQEAVPMAQLAETPYGHALIAVLYLWLGTTVEIKNETDWGESMSGRELTEITDQFRMKVAGQIRAFSRSTIKGTAKKYAQRIDLTGNFVV